MLPINTHLYIGIYFYEDAAVPRESGKTKRLNYLWNAEKNGEIFA